MDTPNTTLGYYESIGYVSRLMLDAARQGNWETIIDAERCCAGLIARLKSGNADAEPLDAPSRRRKFEILKSVLAHDAEIRALTQSRMREIEGDLRSARAARAVATTYTA